MIRKYQKTPKAVVLAPADQCIGVNARVFQSVKFYKCVRCGQSLIMSMNLEAKLDGKHQEYVYYCWHCAVERGLTV